MAQQTENQRLKFFRKHLGLSQQAFADAIGMEQGSISEVENGKTDSVSKSIIRKSQEVFSLNPEWLLSGSGNMTLPEKKAAQPTMSAECLIIAERMVDTATKRLTDQHNLAMEEITKVLRVYENIMRKNKIIS